MDISILLILQDFRNGPGAFLAGFFSKMTWLGELNTVVVIMALIYWCVSKDFGAYLLMGFSGNRLVNGLLKVTACAYRPWIRDARVVPYGDAITTATGYSFPSGHTMNAATLFALWAAFQTDRFKGAAAASPSIWFPGFVEYMRDNTIHTGKVYLSLGDREEKTRNPVMASVGDCIRTAHEILQKKGSACVLEWNKGNHFKDADIRTAAAFVWVMKS